MSDLIYLAIIVGFFAAAVGLLRACERIIGPDAPTASVTPDPGTGSEPVPATAVASTEGAGA